MYKDIKENLDTALDFMNPPKTQDNICEQYGKQIKGSKIKPNYRPQSIAWFVTAEKPSADKCDPVFLMLWMKMGFDPQPKHYDD